jgi:hypothetical protein
MVSRCVFIVALGHLYDCTVLEKGPDFVLHDFPIYTMTGYALSNGHAMCCYRCPSQNTNFMICSEVSVVNSATQPTKGDTLSLDWASSEITTAGFTASTGILCFQDTNNGTYARCAAVGVSDGALSHGPRATVNFAPTGAVAVTTLSESEAVLCYRGGDALSCNQLTLVDMALSIGDDLTLNLERPLEVATAAITATKLILCWRGASTSSAGKCLILVMDGDDATQGPPLQVSSESLGSTSWFASAVALSSRTVTICYQDMVQSTSSSSSLTEPTAKCNALRVRGTLLDKGDDLLLTAESSTPGADDFSTARLSDTLGVVCYHGGQIAHYTTCNTLNLYGNTLAKGPDMVVHDNGAVSISTSPLSDTSVLVCYRSSTITGEKGFCNVLIAQVIQPTQNVPQITTTASPPASVKGQTNGVGSGRPTVACMFVFLSWVLLCPVLW